MKLSRRQFQRLLGGAALGVGLVPSVAGSTRAQNARAPMRFLAVRTPHGVDRDFWVPRQADGSVPASADQALAELTFDYTDSALQPLMAWRSQITVLDGLDTQVCMEATRADRNASHGHNEQGALLTGAQPPRDRDGNYDHHPSLDYYLHNRLPSPTLLTASVYGASGYKCMSYDDAGRPRVPEISPSALFRQAFPANFRPPETTSTAVDYGPGDMRIAQFQRTALERLRGRVGPSERAKLDEHLAVVQRMEAEAAGSFLVAGCTTSGADVPMNPRVEGDPSQVEGVARAHARVIAQAFACGRARTATLQILDDYPNYYSYLPQVRTPRMLELYGANFRFHEDVVHGYWPAQGEDRNELRHAYSAGLRWNAGHFAAVLEELDRTTDPLDPDGASILANTLVFWHSEFGHGPHDRQETRHPAVIAGGGGRVLRLGRYLRVRNIEGDERVPHNRLLTSICQAMGLDDVQFFGDRDLKDRALYRGPLAPLMV